MITKLIWGQALWVDVFFTVFGRWLQVEYEYVTFFTPSPSSPHPWGGVYLPSSLMPICCRAYVVRPQWPWIKFWNNHAIVFQYTHKWIVAVNALSITYMRWVACSSSVVSGAGTLATVCPMSRCQYRYVTIWSSVLEIGHLADGQHRGMLTLSLLVLCASKEEWRPCFWSQIPIRAHWPPGTRNREDEYQCVCIHICCQFTAAAGGSVKKPAKKMA